MKQVFIKSGIAMTEEVPQPIVREGTILVQVNHSCISIGTEMSGVAESRDPLWVRALKRPDKVVRAAKMMAEKGYGYTLDVAQGHAENGVVVGYSLSGTVLSVGNGDSEFAIGDRVSCAGAQCAHHAEIVTVPTNLAVPMPENITFEHASTVALGAIALQGVRRANPTIGETFVVVGLGLIGQMTSQMLRANGCRVLGADLDGSRVELALSNGMDASISDVTQVENVKRITDGIGVDGVIITAASASSDLLKSAFAMCRRKGRVVIVGDIGMNIDRADIYSKELDVLISTSYGPGRYDRSYEEDGHDYPVSYVRWTENRNMRAYLAMLSRGDVRLENLVQKIVPLGQVNDAYEALKDKMNRPLSVLIQYPHDEVNVKPVHTVPYSREPKTGKINVGIIGAGAFVAGTHLPNLKAQDDVFSIHGIMTRTGHKANALAKQYEAAYATTDTSAIINDDQVDLVIIGTRHDSHGTLVLDALNAGKNVLVEKPLALTDKDIDAIEAFYLKPKTSMPVLMTGFNRRFSPLIEKVKKILCDRTGPLMINYRMNAGSLPADHWVRGPEGGGRNLGEACHIYDLFLYLTGGSVTSVIATSLGNSEKPSSVSDNFAAIIKFSDGSVATLNYSSNGTAEFPKEQMEIFADGMVVSMNDYKALRITGAKNDEVTLQKVDKGHAKMLSRLSQSISDGSEWPIKLSEQLETSRIGLIIESMLRNCITDDVENTGIY